MAKTFAIPSSPSIGTYKIENFLGADFTTDAGQIAESKSPNTVNMVRLAPGKIRKRMGFRVVSELNQNISGKINGIYHYVFADMWLIHVGTNLYRFYGDLPVNITTENEKNINTKTDVSIAAIVNQVENINNSELIMSGLADHKSRAYELKQKLIILDGTKARLLSWNADIEELTKGNLEDFAKIPTIRIAEAPDGGGADYEAFNLLTKWFKEQYTVSEANSSATKFHLWTKNIAKDPVTAWVMDSDGNWNEKKENVHFIVDRKNGIVDFEHSSNDTIASYTINTRNNVTDISVNDHSITVTTTFSAVGTTYTVTPKGKSGTTYASKSYTVKESDKPELYIWPRIVITFDFTTAMCKNGMGAPGKSPVTGEDSVRIQAAYIAEGNGADQINHCTFGTLFGVGGEADRLFISGNNDMGSESGVSFSFRNRDWYSERFDPTYFPDTGYAELGANSSAIVGYGRLNNYLMTYKDGNGENQSAYLRSGKTSDDGEPQFPVINALQGAGAVSTDGFGYIGNEPCFLTKKGVYATTGADITGEKYIQNRSYFIDGKLLKEQNLARAISVEYDHYFIIVLNNHMYLIDGLQPLPTSDNEPYATRQYVCFYCELSLPAGFQITEIWTANDGLYFAGTGRQIYKFYEDDTDCDSYNDNGQPIKAVWETADISGNKFWKNKTFRYVAMRVSPALRSSVKMLSQKAGLWEMFKEETQKTRYFTFADVDFRKMAFSSDRTQKLISTKTRIKKIDKVRFRFENDKLNEPVGITQFAIEYTTGGNIK